MKNNVKQFAAIIFYLACTVSAGAQNFLPAGGYFKSFVIHPTNPLIMLAGSDDSGGLWKTTDGGGSWAPTSNLSNGNYVNVTGWRFDVDPLHPDTIWCSEMYGRHGLLRSTDFGTTWQRFNTGLSTAYDKMVTGLVYGSPAGDTLLISTGQDAGGTPPRPGNGIFRSVNGGQSWQHAGLQGITVPAIRKTILGTVFAGTVNNGVYYSNDNGTTWTIHPGLPANLSVNDIETNGQYVVIAAGAWGVYLSSDYGVTFTTIGLVADVNFEIAIERTVPDLQILCATYAGLQRYTGSTGQWTLLSDPNINGRLVMGLECKDSTILVSTFTNSRILRSTDAGQSFVPFSNNPVATEVADYLDAGLAQMLVGMLGTYGIPGLGNAPAVRMAPVSGNSMQERGPATHTLSLLRNPVQLGGHYFLGSFNEGLFATTDTFATYTNIRPGNKAIIDMIDVLPCSNNLVLISEVDWANSTWGCYRSTDNGNTFTLVLPQVVNQLIRHPVFCDSMWAATMNGIYASGDTGNTWVPFALQGQNVVTASWFGNNYDLVAGLETGEIYRCEYGNAVQCPVPYTGRNRLRTVNANGGPYLYIATGGSEQDTTFNLNGGLWATTNLQTWIPISLNGIHCTNFFGHDCIRFDGFTGYAATYGGGIIQFQPPSGFAEHAAEPVVPVYPNPCSNGTMLQLPPGTIGVHVFDLNGRQLETAPLKNTQLPVNFAPGTYLLELIGDDGIRHTQQLTVTE